VSELYDTTVFIDYWRGDTAAVALVDAVRKVPKSASYSSLSVAELWQHPKLDRREEIEYVALTRYFLQEAPLDARAAMRAGTQLRAYSRNARRRLAVDALIAATAERRGECIRTRNWKDIQKFYSNVSAY
jgi:predicted nucleic acid-binding protein